MDPNTDQTPKQPVGNTPEPAPQTPQPPVEQVTPTPPQEPQSTEPVAATPEVVPTQPVYATPTQSETQPDAQGDDPGKTLAIVSIVLAFIFALAGLILAIVARSKSKKAGFKNTLATVGVILNSIFLVLSIIASFFVVSLMLQEVRARAVAADFSNAIRQGDVDTALQYAEVESSDKEAIKAYFLALSEAIGDSQQEVDSANVDDTKVLVYTVTNGTNKYYRVVIKGDKVINASTSDTELSVDVGEPDEIVESE